jgi:hypothetical protein
MCAVKRETGDVSRREHNSGAVQDVGGRALANPTGRLALVAAGVTVVLWASAFVAIRSAGRDFSPGAWL